MFVVLLVWSLWHEHSRWKQKWGFYVFVSKLTELEDERKSGGKEAAYMQSCSTCKKPRIEAKITLFYFRTCEWHRDTVKYRTMEDTTMAWETEL